MENKIKMWY